MQLTSTYEENFGKVQFTIPIDFDDTDMPPYAWSTQLDSLKSIDMTYLKQWGVLAKVCHWGNYVWSRNGEETGRVSYSTNLDSPDGNHMKLDYKVRNGQSEEWKGMDYRVRMVTTSCHFGSVRWWFICPNSRCNRRCRKLYSYGDYFVCHKCTGYWYDSQTWSNQRFRPIKKYFDADDYYRDRVKREFYNGKPTKKYLKYLRMSNSVSHEEVMAALAI